MEAGTGTSPDAVIYSVEIGDLKGVPGGDRHPATGTTGSTRPAEAAEDMGGNPRPSRRGPPLPGKGGLAILDSIYFRVVIRRSFVLTSTSPAILSYHLQIDWKRAVGAQAGKAVGMRNCQVDASIYRQVISRGDLSGKDRALLRAYTTHAVWSPQRLCDVGYDVDIQCALCGEEADSLGHRLFRCACTKELRDQYLAPHDVDFLKYSADIRALGSGLQIMPEPVAPRRRGIGHEEAEEWTLTGGPIEDILVGEVFTDGSCYKHGPPTWNHTGWSICKVSRDGVLLGWLRGSVGGQLPQTSPASEHVAVLALAMRAAHHVEALSNYKGLEGLEDAPSDVISYRKSIYSGLKLQARARAPKGFKVVKVQGHANVEACDTPADRFRAIGNDFADQIAKGAAMNTPSPTQAQMREHQLQVDFLKRIFTVCSESLGALASSRAD